MGKKQRAKTEHNGSNSMDMISELPQPILHHILSFLSERYATQTSVLSKTWLDVWSTRPKIELCEGNFPWRSKLFLPALDNLFQRYHDLNLSIQELSLMMVVDSESVLVLNKWIPIVNVFSLHIFSYCNSNIPYSVLVAESLKKLCMENCTLSDRNPPSVGKFTNLQTLHLVSVIIEDNALVKMVSTCPRLKSLTLDSMKLSNDSLNLFSSNHMPSLEYLDLQRCYGFTEFHLVSRSIKHLIMIINTNWKDHVEKVTILAPSILYFKYSSSFIPSICFTTTSDHEWKSEIDLSFEKVDADSSWFVKLNKLLSALSRSEISLTLHHCQWKETEEPQDDDVDTRLYRRPVMVENLKLCLRPADLFRDFIHDLLFRVCHPRNISFYKGSQFVWKIEHKKFDEVLYEILIMERESTGHYLWRPDLEEVSVEAFDESGKREHWPSLDDLNRLCFRLKWR
ncbi:hypothetical protein CASFOL_019515 [Castilleja foliolosa]|uniref:F-box domain-containing protein n=1 Tax=Castilleja foliolosa TaxID=1961234 RepID=A0ABD3D6K3_9LAMI